MRNRCENEIHEELELKIWSRENIYLLRSIEAKMKSDGNGPREREKIDITKESGRIIKEQIL